MLGSRRSIGYTYKSARQWRVDQPTLPNTNLMNNISKDYVAQEADMGGAGIIDLAKSGYEKAKNAVEKVAGFYGSETGKRLLDYVPSTDDTARPGFSGENHAILKLANGVGIANYMGPGTAVTKRVSRQDVGRSPVDMLSMRHDIDYTIAAAEAKNKNELIKLGRKADLRMIEGTKRLAANKGDHKANILLAKAISAKVAAENLGILSKDKFIGDLEKLSDKDLILLKSKRAELTQKGYGNPGEKLKHKLMMKYSGKGLGGDGCCEGSGSRLAGKKRGSGSKLASSLKEFLVRGYVKRLGKDLGIDLPIDMILKILKQQDPSTPNAVSDVLAKILTPIINKKQPIKDASKKPELNEKLKKGIMGAISFYMKTRKQSGGGVSLAGAGKYTSSYVKALKQNI